MRDSFCVCVVAESECHVFLVGVAVEIVKAFGLDYGARANANRLSYGDGGEVTVCSFGSDGEAAEIGSHFWRGHEVMEIECNLCLVCAMGEGESNFGLGCVEEGT